MPLAPDVDEPESQPRVAWPQLKMQYWSTVSFRLNFHSSSNAEGARFYRFFVIVLSSKLLFLVLRRVSSSTSITHATASWACGPVSPPRSLSNTQKGALYIATNTAITRANY